MKKIFSVLVVAFFLAATFVLVPQSNYLAFAQEDEEEDGQEENPLGRTILEEQVSSPCSQGCTPDTLCPCPPSSPSCRLRLDGSAGVCCCPNSTPNSTPNPTPTLTPTPTPNSTPTPTPTPNSTPTPTPTPTPNSTPTPTPTPTPNSTPTPTPTVIPQPPHISSVSPSRVYNNSAITIRGQDFQNVTNIRILKVNTDSHVDYSSPYGRMPIIISPDGKVITGAKIRTFGYTSVPTYTIRISVTDKFGQSSNSVSITYQCTRTTPSRFGNCI